MSKATMPPVSVIVENDYGLRWVGADPIAKLVDRTGAKPGSVFITTDQAEAYADARVKQALEEAAMILKANAEACHSDTRIMLRANAEAILDLLSGNSPNL